MPSTTLDPQFLSAAALTQDFKPRPMLEAKAALLRLALTRLDFTAAEIASATNHSPTLAGCAAGSLISIGLLVPVGRVKSPNPSANGRRVNVLRLAEGKHATVLAWFRANNLPLELHETQGTLEISA